jgi:hypothetical protein
MIMKTLSKEQPLSFARFRSAVIENTLMYPFTGKHEKVYTLRYGFNGDHNIKEVNNLKDAYNKYKENFKHYNKYISEESYLLNWKYKEDK